jgi:hypothetical protein
MKTLTTLLALALATAAYAQATAPAATIEAPDDDNQVTIESMGFGKEVAFRGPDWSVEQYQDAQGNWRARFVANNATVADLGDCGSRAEWMRFLTWPLDDSHPGRLLAVLRYEGGAQGSDALDLFHLEDNYRTLLDVEGDFNFRGIRDLNADGWPEVIGVTRKFANMMLLNHESSPFPLMVIGYHEPSRQYVCLNFAYGEALRARAQRHKERFESDPASTQPITYTRTDTRQQDAFAKLLQWVVSLAYMGDEEGAWAYLADHTAGSTYVWAKEEIERLLGEDRYYQQMKRIETALP